ncbi:MAG: glucosamine-6-phosphate deaminase [Chloroflexota bacterium]
MTEPIRTLQIEQLPIEIYPNNELMGQAAALSAQATIQAAIGARGEANLILATGNSQLTFLHALRKLEGIDWSVITIFHMDEYLGIDPAHPASFPNFLKEHIIDHVQPNAFHPVPGNPADVDKACAEYEALLRQHPADLVALGYGENGHLAFNDPPYAKFDDPVWVKVIQLDEMSRRQQVGEGHFGSLDDVPKEAITLTIPALLAPSRILAIVPESRKANAVHDCLTLAISEDRPGSILRQVSHATLYLEQESASKISELG